MAWIASLKIVLISSGVVALALAMKLSVPLAMEFIASHVPLMFSSIRSLLKPPYIYVLVNGIIITIVASSRFHHNRSPQPKVQPESESDQSYSSVSETPLVVYEQRDPEPVIEVMPAMINGSVEAEPEPELLDPAPEPELLEPEPEPEPAMINGFVEAEPELELPEPEIEDDREYEDKLVVSRSTWTPPESAISSDEITLPAEKPLVTTRFGHRKPARSSPEVGRPLRASKPKRNDTLENTWKAITEGRSMPLSRHMKKCENHGRQLNADSVVVDTSAILKSETFNDRTKQKQLTGTTVAVSPSVGKARERLRKEPSIGAEGGKLRKEPSLGQDELNHRVEAFINKFNEEMRLQRQQSLNQYMEMINR